MEKKIQNFNSSIFLFFFTLTLFVSFPTRTVAQLNTTIYLDSTKQVISGFGGANVIIFGRPNMTNSQIETAFGTGEGQLGFTILRLSIQTNSNQWSSNVNAAKKAYDMGAKIIASPWSPPALMKTNNSTVGGGELKETSYADYAAHLNAFGNYMSDNGVPIYAISVQNEPDVNVSYESCDWNASQMLKFVKENGSSIQTRIMAPESFQFRRNLSDPLLNDSTATANLDIVAGHIYGGGIASYPLAESKGKEIWMTEYLINSGSTSSTNPTSVDTGWAGAMQTAKSIHDCMVVNMNAYVWWYIVRFYGPIDDGTFNSANAGIVTKKGYVMSQFSRFIRPGYMRVDATANPQAGVYVTAYKSDSKAVIVVVNNSSSSKDQTFTFQNGSVAKFTPYVTSQAKNCDQENDIIVSNGSFTATLDASSVTTFVSDATLVPVELISFNAQVIDNKVNLSWITATEKNNAGFEIQRSYNNSGFYTVGYLKGNGTTTERQSYSFVDYASGEKLYYRLKQIDFSGTFEYSNIVEVSTVPLTFSLFQNYPNPFNPVTQIKYSIPEDGYVTLKVYNLVGEELVTIFDGNRAAGYYTSEFNGSELAGGVYFYQLKVHSIKEGINNYSETKKLIILK